MYCSCGLVWTTVLIITITNTITITITTTTMALSVLILIIIITDMALICFRHHFPSQVNNTYMNTQQSPTQHIKIDAVQCTAKMCITLYMMSCATSQLRSCYP